MLWGEVRERRIVTHLKQAAASLEAESDEGGDASLAEARKGGAALLREEAEKREGSADYVIRIKHIGSPADPMRFASLRAGLSASRHAARARARKVLLAEGEPVTEDAITERMTLDPDWHPALGKATVEILKEGLEGGEAEIERLYKLGGGDLLFQAMVEVTAAQEVSAEMGEG